VISTASLPLIHAGKVRRLYALGDPNTVLIVATDAISAFDQVLSTPIPDKGAILTQLSVWWSEQLRDIVDNHLISEDVPTDVQGRAVVAERLEMIPVECVARGYITGSGWAEYQVTGSIAGIGLPEGLQHADRLPEPIFTPARKAPQGEHDENITYEQLVEMVGDDVADQLRDLTLHLFARGARIAAERDIILADTKFEFGRRPDGVIVLADEVLTPDSSRFWDAAQWSPGSQIPSFDKQYVRDWLAYDSGWDKNSDTPAPPLPRSVIQATRDRYLEAHARLTGRQFSPTKAHSPASLLHEAATRRQPTSRFIVDVMPKAEILDPQGKAIGGALSRLGYAGYSVRQGKRFEIETTRGAGDDVRAEVEAFAESLLANTVIEDFTVRLDGPDPAQGKPGARGSAAGPDGAPEGAAREAGSRSAPGPSGRRPGSRPPGPAGRPRRPGAAPGGVGPGATPGGSAGEPDSGAEPRPAGRGPGPGAAPGSGAREAGPRAAPDPAREPGASDDLPWDLALGAPVPEAGVDAADTALSTLSSELAQALEALQATAQAMAHLSSDNPSHARPESED
jgi:phosphoribosylaminoimidazole-succinocarboxamide synthase